jgi:hypothetical protein
MQPSGKPFGRPTPLAAKRTAKPRRRLTARAADPPRSRPAQRAAAPRRNGAWSRGQQLANEGQQLLERSQLDAARTKFQRADQALAGQSVVTDGWPNPTASGSLPAADDGRRAGRARQQTESALDKYTQARAADPGQFAADNIDARVKSVGDGLKAAANTTRPVPAPAAPPAASALDSKHRQQRRGLAGQDAATLRSALVVLLRATRNNRSPF